MSLVRSALISLCAVATTSAFKISSFSHSGSACPQGSDVSWNGNHAAPVFYLNDVSASVSAGQYDNCELHLTIDEGNANQALVLGEVSVWGGLSLAANGAANFYTTAFWSETAESATTKRVESSTRSAFTGNVAVDATLNLASPCVGRDGHVGILNINFRVASVDGKVAFGPEKSGSKSTPVSEHLKLTWADC